ncbi:hypothetical protein [Actinomadura hibisca]|uniref:hypothetical protein n=1 Tax=Actinomadura hibisca TaxID=68565 RepID=UPI0008342CDA|nr:hypothetical protein [Actinomadura hibisca]
MLSLSRRTLLSLAGLLVGIAGLVIQWIADPDKFADALSSFVVVPPGILFIAVAGLLTLLTARWWWHPVFGVLIAFWIVGVGTLAGQLTPNLTSSNAGTVTGNVVMAAGLAFAFVVGILSMIEARRARPAGTDRPQHANPPTAPRDS